jgi:hypothetical protein
MPRLDRSRLLLVLLTASLILGFALVWSPSPGQPTADLHEGVFEKPDLSLSTHSVPLEVVIAKLANNTAWNEFVTGQPAGVAVLIDPRSGTPSNIVCSHPVIPGSGVGNQVTLADLGASLGTPLQEVTAEAVAEAVRRFVLDHQDVFAADPAQIGPAYASKVTDALWQVSMPQQVNGIPVRDARIVATISHGNLVVIGTSGWGNVALNTTPAITAGEAKTIGFAYAGGSQPQDMIWKEPVLEIVSYTPPSRALAWDPDGPIGGGYAHRLIWVFGFERPPSVARWEVMVEAHTGEVIAFKDTIAHANRHIKGGVYPATNTEVCDLGPSKCGVMQPGYPMPWADYIQLPTPTYTNGAGAFDSADPATTTLNGRYVKIVDAECGSTSKPSASGDLDLEGLNFDHGCTWNQAVCVGGVCLGGPFQNGPCTVDDDCNDATASSASARTTYYEINRMLEITRGWLESNPWPRQEGPAKLEARVNGICAQGPCDGCWLGNNRVRFTGENEPEEEGPECRPAGELSTIVAHELGHGLDDNDQPGMPGEGAESNPREAYADVAAMYRHQASCSAYGIWIDDPDTTGDCGTMPDGTYKGDEDARSGATNIHCLTDCSGFRDADYLKHADGIPDTPQNHVCPLPGGRCTGSAHCLGAPVTQAAWDFAARDLQAAPFNYDSRTAFLVASRIFFQGSGNVGLWYQKDCAAGTSGGCNADSGYMQWVAADDNNGNLLDGTPHMTALYNAFHRHGIACSPSVAAISETTNIGSVIEDTSWTDTWTSNNVREILEEGLNGGASRLDHVWRFDNLTTDVPRSLVLEGLRPNNPDGDNFQFYYSNNGTSFTAITGALINKIFEPAGGLVYPFGGTYSPTVFIKVLDTQATGSSLDTVEIDLLRVGGKDPTPQNSGCALYLTQGPALTVVAVPTGKSLAWNAVSGATEYWVFRTEGHAGCNLGMARIAKVSGGISYIDTEVAAGREYYYAVMASNGAETCFGRSSACVAAPLQ